MNNNTSHIQESTPAHNTKIYSGVSETSLPAPWITSSPVSQKPPVQCERKIELIPKDDESSPLLIYHAKEVAKRTMQYFDQLCADRHIQLDRDYWKNSSAILLNPTVHDPFGWIKVVGCYPGYGKSTWISAFILALVYLSLSPEYQKLIRYLGGIVVVLQKVETLNEIMQTIEKYFPGKSKEVMTPLQSWTPSGREAGYCQNPHIHSFSECRDGNCLYAPNCPLIKLNESARYSLIIGMTQARFQMLYKTGHCIIPHTTPDGDLARRFFLFDEKLEMLHRSVLNKATICDAVKHIEENTEHTVSDRTLQTLSSSIYYQIERPFSVLRKQCILPGDKSSVRDQLFGFCSLRSEESAEKANKLERFLQRISSMYPSLMSEPLQDAVNVMVALNDPQTDCLFSKLDSFTILQTSTPDLHLGNARTIIFDATAGVDADYDWLPSTVFLPSPSRKHIDRLHIHVYDDPLANVSKAALSKPWRIPAFADLIDEIVDTYPAPTFLCTYKEFCTPLYAQLSPDTVGHLILTKQKILPYFGGTNGSNAFRDCTNVILLGYPRLSPQEYLFRSYSYGNRTVFREQAEEAIRQMSEQGDTSYPQESDYLLPMVKQYEAHHLAARVEQELYRCAIRDPNGTTKIHVFLFFPPRDMLALLENRLKGCQIQNHELPSSFSLQKALSRKQKNGETKLQRLDHFFEKWSGSPIQVGQLQQELAMTAEAWHHLSKSDNFRALLEKHHVQATGRGKNRKYFRHDPSCL